MPVYTSAVGKPRPDGRWHYIGRCVRDIDLAGCDPSHLLLRDIKSFSGSSVAVDVYRWVYWHDQVRHRIYETPVHTFWPNGVAA